MTDKYAISSDKNSIEVYGSLLDNGKVIVNYNYEHYIFHNDSGSSKQVAFDDKGNKIEETLMYQKIIFKSGLKIIKTNNSIKLIQPNGKAVYKDRVNDYKEIFNKNNINFSFSVHDKKNDKKQKPEQEFKYHTKKTIKRLIPGGISSFFLISGLLFELILGFSLVLNIALTLYIVYSTIVISYYFSRLTSMKILQNTFDRVINKQKTARDVEESEESVEYIKQQYKNDQITEDEFEQKLDELFNAEENRNFNQKDTNKELINN